MFWLGDLNFRLEEREDLTFESVTAAVSAGQLRSLLERDTLSVAMASGRAFPLMEEGDIAFKPTYKFKIGSHEYDPK